MKGVPPTPAQLKDWLKNPSDTTYEKLVERLLSESDEQHWLFLGQRIVEKELSGEDRKKVSEDLNFLNRVSQDARGTPPTLLEVEYFKADKDPKKNEKLLDLFLKDPALARKLGDSWKKKMLEPAETAKRVAAFDLLMRRRGKKRPSRKNGSG